MNRTLLRISLLLVSVLISFSAVAGNASSKKILDEIKAKGAAFTTLSTDFEQVKTLAANGRQIKSEGQLYYYSGHFAMHYTVPETDILIISGDRFYMIQGKRKKDFNTQKNKPIGNLSNTLLSSMYGDLERLAQDTNSDLEAQEEKGIYVAHLVAREKTPHGYSDVILKYDKTTGFLLEMTMIEFNANVTVYSMTNYKEGLKLDDSLFTIPKK